MTGDPLTVLASPGIYATKRFARTKTGDLKNRSYGNAKHFRVKIIPVADFAGLCAVLTELASDPYSFVIRGVPLPHTNLAYTRRLLRPDKKTREPATFEAAPHHWFAIDVDHLAAPPLTDPVTDPEGCIEYLIGKLPPELADISFWWQFTGSQSLPGSEDTLSARLWGWSPVPLTDAALTRWPAAANRDGKVIDPVLYRAIQAHYIAAPIFEGGMTDPLPRRCGVRQGLEDEVVLVIPPADPKNPEVASGEGYPVGRGVKAYLDEIGGGRGFREPILSAIASYVATYGSKADCTKLKAAICKAIDEAIKRREQGGRTDKQIERYKSDKYLDAIIEWTRTIHGDQPPKGFVGEPPPGFDDPPPAEPVDQPDLLGGLPAIVVIAGLRPQAADQGLPALAQAGVAFYQRNATLVRVCLIKAKASDGKVILVPGVMPIPPAMLGRALGLAAHWARPGKRGALFLIDPPGPVVEQILSMIEDWPFPPLTGVITCPTLRPDGSLLDAEGYDAATGLVLYKTLNVPPINMTPTKEEAQNAIRMLDDELLTGFPFADDASRSVALSKILTPILRGAFTVAPMHQTSAPMPGTGKSYLDDVASAVVTGERCAVISMAPRPEETEKRLIGAALAGHPIITVDNVRAVLEGDFFAQVTERPLLQLRPLGTSAEVRVANTFTVNVNGNNLVVADDLVRRAIRATLDADSERPEERKFTSNPLAIALSHRGIYIAAGLTIARAYIVAGRPRRFAPLPSYEGWSDLIRSALGWLGYPDPVMTMDEIRGSDPVRQDRDRVFMAWKAELGMTARFLAAELVEAAESRYSFNNTLAKPQLHAAFLAVAAKRGNSREIDPRRLGIWLKKNENTISGKAKLTVDRSDYQRPYWKLDPHTK